MFGIGIFSCIASAALLWAVRRALISADMSEPTQEPTNLYALFAGAAFGATPLLALEIGAGQPATEHAAMQLAALALCGAGGICSTQINYRYGQTTVSLFVAGVIYSIFAIAAFGVLSAARDSASGSAGALPVVLLAAPPASLFLHFMTFGLRLDRFNFVGPTAAGFFFGALSLANPLRLTVVDNGVESAPYMLLAAGVFLLLFLAKPKRPIAGEAPSLNQDVVSLFDAFPPGVSAILIDSENHLIAATQQARRFVGEAAETQDASVFHFETAGGHADPHMRAFIDHSGVKRFARIHEKIIDHKTNKAKLIIFESADDLVSANATLQTTEKRMNAAFSTSDDLLIFASENGQVAEINKAALRFVKKSKNDCIGEYFWSLFSPAEKSPSVKDWGALMNAAAQEGVVGSEAVLAGGDGERLFRISVSKTSADGDAEFLLRGRDITETTRMRISFQEAQRRLEQTIARRTQELSDAKKAADEANLSKSRFLANMSHELRTPLNAILGYTDLMIQDLEDEAKTDSQSYKDLDRIRINAKHLLALINDILDLAKVEANKTELSYGDVALREFIGEIKASVDPLAAKNSNRFHVRCERTLEKFSIDRQKVKQCLLNLISNAAKFTKDGDIILTVTSQLNGETRLIAFEVKDTGRGMTQEQCAAIFEEFVQAEGGDDLEASGTGLGLPIAKRFAQLMGGDLTAASAPGKGSTFTLSVRDGPAEAANGESKEAAA